MIDRDDGDRVRAFAQPLEAFDHDGGGKVGGEIDDGARAKLRERPRGGGEIGAELRVEGVLALEQKGECALGSVRTQPLLEEGRGVKADPLRGAQNPLRRRSPHAMARIEHPVDGRDAHICGLSQIGDGRTAAQAESSGVDESFASLAAGMMMDFDRK